MATNQPPAVLAREATEKNLQRIAKSVGSNWEMLWPYLLKQNAMAKVEQIKDHHKTEMRIYNLLLTWRQQAAPDTTLGHLFHQMLQAGTSLTVDWRSIAKYLDIDERDIRACKKGYQPPVQERSTNLSIPGKKGYQPPVQERSTILSIPDEQNSFQQFPVQATEDEPMEVDSYRRVTERAIREVDSGPVTEKGKIESDLGRVTAKEKMEVMEVDEEHGSEEKFRPSLEDRKHNKTCRPPMDACISRDNLTEPEKPEGEAPKYQHVFKTRTESDDIDLSGQTQRPDTAKLNDSGDTHTSNNSHNWDYCSEHSDWENAETLLSQGILPDKEQLKIVCIKLGRKSDLIQKICRKICGHIDKSKEGNFKVFPAVQPGKETDIIFVITGKKENENETCEYDCVYQSGSAEMKAILRKRKELAKQKHLGTDERGEIKQCIDKLDVDFFKQHKKLSLVEPSPYRSKGYRLDRHKLVEETCIVLGVTIKGYLPIEEDELPTKIGRFKTDIREITINRSQGGSPFDFHENIKMNCVISRTQKNRNDPVIEHGTMGVFMSQSCNNCLGMTCAHVLLRENEMKDILCDKRVWQPTGINCNQPNVGSTFSKRCGLVKYALFTEDVDVVLFSPDKARLPQNGYFPGNCTNIVSPLKRRQELSFLGGQLWDADKCTQIFGTPVMKMPGGGVADTITYGEMLTDGAITRDPEVKDYIYIQRNQIHVISDTGFFSKSGDSGSCIFWIDEQNDLHAVGMIVTDNSKQDGACLGESFAAPMSRICKAFAAEEIHLSLYTFSSDWSQDDQQIRTEMKNGTSVGNDNNHVKPFGEAAIDRGATGEGINGDESAILATPKNETDKENQQSGKEVESRNAVGNDIYHSFDESATGEGRANS